MNSGSSKSVSTPNDPQVIWSRVDSWISRETRLFFNRRWKAFKTDSNISGQNASIQLFQCVHNKLGDLMLANDPRLMVKSEEAKLMESVAVMKVAGGIKRAELVSLHQPR